MTTKVGVGGAHRTVSAMWVGVGGAWRPVVRADVGVGGAWRLGHAAVTFAGNYSANATALSPSNANASVRIDADGHVYRIVNGSETDLGTWLPAGDPGDYDALVTVTSGSLSSGTEGLVNLNASPSWLRTRSGLGTSTAELSLSIRLAGTSTEVDTTTISLSATVDI